MNAIQQKNILLSNDGLLVPSLKRALDQHNFNTTLVPGTDKAIMSSLSERIYDLLVLDTDILPEWYFTQEQLESFVTKFASNWKQKSLGEYLTLGGTKSLDTAIWKNIWLAIHEIIRNQEQEIQIGAKYIRRLPIVFYTSKAIDDLFSQKVLDPVNTFFVSKIDDYQDIVKYFHKILSSAYFDLTHNIHIPTPSPAGS